MNPLSSVNRAKLVDRVKNADILFCANESYRQAYSRVRAYNFAGELKRRGINAEVLSLVEDFMAADGQNYIRYGFWPANQRYMFRKLMDMQEILSQNSRSIFFAQKADMHFYPLVMAAAANGNKIILDYDDNHRATYHMDERLSDLVDDFHPQGVLLKAAQRADCCIAASHALYDLLQTYNSATHLIYTVVDTAVFDFDKRITVKRPDTVDPGKVNLVWAGTLNNPEITKDVMLGIQAFLDIPAAIRQKACLHIYGFGSYWDPATRLIRTIAQNAGAEDQIAIHGFVTPDDMPDIFACMDIGLISMRHDFYTSAKSPTKMFEYMAMGVAVCASASGQPARILEDGITGFVAADTKEYTEKLGRLIGDSALRARIAANGRELLNAHYSLRAAGEQLQNIIAPMLKT